MDWITLPPPRKNIALAFNDASSAEAWIARQASAEPLPMITAIGLQIEAIEAAAMPADQAIELLDLLRSAAAVPHEALIPRYLRKPLPMTDDENRAFAAAQHLWLRLGIAYLRRTPPLPVQKRALPLNRAASAVRMAQYGHFQAARQCPDLLGRLLIEVLAQAAADGLLDAALSDPAFPHLGHANIAGHLIWAFLLQRIDPYRLTAAQLAVANRALSRWRELGSFQTQPPSEPGRRCLDLQAWFDAGLPEDIPRWLELRRIDRKIRQRIARLEAGDSPEALKLGRELSGTACIRLLKAIERSLGTTATGKPSETGELELAFGPDHAFAAFTGELPDRPGSAQRRNASVAQQRMALFGFDEPAVRVPAARKLAVPGEKWQLADGQALRSPENDSARHLAPCLIAAIRSGQPQLGIMQRLQIDGEGTLIAGLRWFPDTVEAHRLPAPPGAAASRATPAFLVQEGSELSLVVPSTIGTRLAPELTLEGATPVRLAVGEAIERGFDFVRYAVSTK